MSVTLVTSVFLIVLLFDNNTVFAQVLPIPENQDNTQPVENSFSIYQEKLFKLSYPSNWTKEQQQGAKFTGVESTSRVSFEDSLKRGTVVISLDFIGNRLLSEYAAEEIAALNNLPNFKLEQSSPTILGNNTAQKIVYTNGIVKNGVIAGTVKTMEIVTIKGGGVFFFLYSAKENDFPTLLPIVNKMISSFEILWNG